MTMFSLLALIIRKLKLSMTSKVCMYKCMYVRTYVRTSVWMCVCTYGVPFVTSILLLTEAHFVKQKSLLSNKSSFCQTKVILSTTKVILSYRQK